MSARRGWIGEPQPPREWHESIYSRMARYFENEPQARTTTDDYDIDSERAELAVREGSAAQKYTQRMARDSRTDTLQIAERYRPRQGALAKSEQDRHARSESNEC